jgi:hypothetical protein
MAAFELLGSAGAAGVAALAIDVRCLPGALTLRAAIFFSARNLA